MPATPEARTLTITPSARSLAWSGGLMSVGNVFAVTVAIPATETWTFEDGHTYRLTAKRVGELSGSALSWWAITVTGERAGTIALDLSGSEFEAQIGSGDWLGVQWGVDDLAYGPMGVECAGCASLLGNRAYRSGDTAPTNPSTNTYTDAEIDALIAGVSAGAFDMSALDARVDALGDDTLVAVQEPAETVPKKATKSFLTAWLGGVYEALGTMASHLLAYAHADIASNSAHRTTVTGNPHAVTAGQVGADAAGTAAGLMSTHTTTHPAPTTRDDRNEAAGTAAGLLSTHETTHPAPTTRDARNEAAGTAAGLLSTHETTHPAPTTRDSRNEAAGTAAGLMITHTTTHPIPTTRDDRNEAAGTASGLVGTHESTYAHGDIAANSGARHTQGTDQGLDTGGENAVTAEQAKAAYTHSTTAHAPSDAEANVQSDWDATEGDALILNKPTLGTAAALDVPASGNAAATEVVKGDDGRLADARTPTAHAASHATGKSDAIAPSDIGAEAAQSAASQAEAEAGTDTAVRSWSPVRIWQGVTGKLLSILTAAGTVLYRGSSGLAALTLRTAVRATGTADDTSVATEKAVRAGIETRYRQQTPATAAEKGGASVAPDFASALTLPWTLTSNLTSFDDAANLADGETGMILITIGEYSLPADPPSGAYKGAWTVTGTLVRVVIERIGSAYLWSADSLGVVA